MATHTLDPTEATLHGQFSSSLDPCLTVAPGDQVSLRTVDVTWGVEQHGAPGTPRQRVSHADTPRNDGPALLGPIAVEGAEPGDALAISFDEIVPAGWGWSYVGDSLFNASFNKAVGVEEELLLRWSLDTDAGTAESERGHALRLHPFLGTVGCAPADPGWHSGWRPRPTGGNLDCPLLTAGATLILPVEVDGALLSLGDGHAVQGDGELGGSAIECPMESVTIRLTLRKQQAPTVPRVVATEKWGTLGMGETLEHASQRATREMIDWLEEERDVERSEALTLLSLSGSLRVTQLVNGTVGTHLLFAPDAEGLVSE